MHVHTYYFSKSKYSFRYLNAGNNSVQMKALAYGIKDSEIYRLLFYLIS